MLGQCARDSLAKCSCREAAYSLEVLAFSMPWAMMYSSVRLQPSGRQHKECVH